MQSYLSLLDDILRNGEPHTDRTGVGTLSVFGRQWRHDMRTGFPLLTTKKMPLRWVFEELRWFLSGSTNEKDLSKEGVDIWKEWRNNDDELGPVYGKQWRHQDTIRLVKQIHRPRPSKQKFETPEGMDKSHSYQPSFCGVACMGSIMGQPGGEKHFLLETWKGMIQRCYYPSHQAFDNYGGRGVWVCDRWLVFSNFVEDFELIEDWELKAEYPGDYTLDKDMSGSNVYSPATCRWASKREQSVNTADIRAFKATGADGSEIISTSAAGFAREHGLIKQSILACIRGRQSQHKNWLFEPLPPAPDGFQLVYREVDQIKTLLAQISQTPNSRRLVVSAWNPLENGTMSLVPCHTLWQLKCHGQSEMSLHLYARSIDSFLGLPFNIASYALLLSMLCAATDRRPRELIISFGDLHLYTNHIEQAKLQLQRKPHTLPILGLTLPEGSTRLERLLNFKWENVGLYNYVSHGKIKADVAV
jgi:thymidylate synthase